MGYCPHCGEEVDPRDLQVRDNSFRDEPDEGQTRLDEIAGIEESGPSDDPSVWDRAGLDDGAIRDLDVTGPELAFGEVLNENDPTEW